MRRILLLSLPVVILAVLLLSGTAYSRGAPSNESTPDVTVAARSAGQAALEGPAAVCDYAAISEEDAHRAVWNLPEVALRADQLRTLGIRPFTMTASAPDDDDLQYTIYFGEDHGTHTVHVATYLVDAHTGQVSTDQDSSEPAGN